MKTVLRVQEFEDRLVPAVAIDSAPEAYSWVLVNTLRQNPTAFANNLQGLVNGTVESAFGFSKTDPVVTDLKGMINRASFPANYSASLNLMRSTAGAGPLGWDETLESRAGAHNDWMKVDGFAHTGTTGGRVALPGYSKNDSAPADVWGYSGQYSMWGEDIGYGYGYLRTTKGAYNLGSIALAGFQQRAAFIDTVGYMLELNSGTLGHLKNLLGRDSGVGGTLPTFNAIGIDSDLYEAPGAYEVQDGIAETFLSTHRLGLYRPGGSGGFIAGVVYTDSNHNGFYDVGEGSAVTVNVRNASGSGFTDSLSAANYGGFSGYVGNGTYTVTISSAGSVLDSRVVTVNNSNAWTGFQVGTVGRPSLTSPVGSQNALRPTVAWMPGDHATGYQVRVDDLTTGATNLFNNAGTGGTNWTPWSDLVSGRAYRVWVRAVQNGTVGAWSDPKDFSVAYPRKNGPLRTVNDDRPVFSWTSVAGATSYAIRVNDVSGQVTDILPGAAATGTSWHPPIELVSGRTYTWQVRAVNQTGLGEWSPLTTFVVGKPIPTGPSTGVANLRPTFTWTSVGNASSYEILVNDNSAAVPSLFRVRAGGTNWAPPTDLVSGRTYTWQVRAVNSLGQGIWSPLAGFSVGRPRLTGPVGDVASQRPTFTWSGIGFAPAYQIRVDDLTTGQTNLYLATVGHLDWVPPADLTAAHTYRWCVRAINASGLGTWSPAQNFRIV
jgi:hypothetical protein